MLSISRPLLFSEAVSSVANSTVQVEMLSDGATSPRELRVSDAVLDTAFERYRPDQGLKSAVRAPPAERSAREGAGVPLFRSQGICDADCQSFFFDSKRA